MTNGFLVGDILLLLLSLMAFFSHLAVQRNPVIVEPKVTQIVRRMKKGGWFIVATYLVYLLATGKTTTIPVVLNLGVAFIAFTDVLSALARLFGLTYSSFPSEETCKKEPS